MLMEQMYVILILNYKEFLRLCQMLSYMDKQVSKK